MQPKFDTRAEQALLRRSIAATLTLGLVGIGIGLSIGSQAILFDGFFGIIDVAMTATALVVSTLLTREGSRRFQYGYWHLEPLVVAGNGTVLTLACLYAALTAVTGLLGSGHVVAFGPGAAYALLVSLASLAIHLYLRRRAEALDSDLLRIDARGWLMGTALHGAILGSFVATALMTDTVLDPWARYADSTILLLIALCLLPIPISGAIRALRDVFLVAPDALHVRVQTVTQAVSERHGFARFSTYVAKIGRARFIEIHLLARPDHPCACIADLDLIREEIASGLGGAGPQRWLTISFTADERWM